MGHPTTEDLQRLDEINLLWKVTAYVNAERKYKYAEISLKGTQLKYWIIYWIFFFQLVGTGNRDDNDTISFSLRALQKIAHSILTLRLHLLIITGVSQYR
jgi:hypothetical protein